MSLPNDIGTSFRKSHILDSDGGPFEGAGKYLSVEVATETKKSGGQPVTQGIMGIQVGRVTWPISSVSKSRVAADTFNSDAILSRRIQPRGQNTSPTVANPQGIGTRNGVAMLDGHVFEIDRKLADTLQYKRNVDVIYGKDVPHGIDGITVRGAAPGQFNNNVFIPCWNNMLVAHHDPLDPPKWSTDVHDIDERALDKFRFAGLHGPLWVKQLGERDCVDIHDHDYQVCFNFTRARGPEPINKSHAGYGLAVFPGTPQEPPEPTTGRPESVKPVVAPATGRGKKVSLHQGLGRVFPPTPGQQLKKAQMETLAYLSHDTMCGPLWHGHPTDDKHKITENLDGESINSGHIHVAAYFYQDIEADGPLNFGGIWEKEVDAGFWAKTWIKWNPKPPHKFICGESRKGKWWPQTRIPSIPIEPGPGVPDDPSDPPPPAEPPIDWTPYERDFPSQFGRARPCILKGEPGRTESMDGRDALFAGVSLGDWMQSPHVYHTFATGRLSVTTAKQGKSGIGACPPDYTRHPIIRETEGFNHFPGTSDGCFVFAPPELRPHHSAPGQSAPSTMSKPTLLLYGCNEETQLAFGCLTPDLGGPASGMRIYFDGTDVQFRSVDANGDDDSVHGLKLNGTSIGGGVGGSGTAGRMPYWSASTTLANAGSNTLDASGNMQVYGNFTHTGTIFSATGPTIYIGNASSDTFYPRAHCGDDLVPSGTVDLGDATDEWDKLFVGAIKTNSSGTIGSQTEDDQFLVAYIDSIIGAYDASTDDAGPDFWIDSKRITTTVTSVVDTEVIPGTYVDNAAFYIEVTVIGAKDDLAETYVKKMRGHYDIVSGSGISQHDLTTVYEDDNSLVPTQVTMAINTGNLDVRIQASDTDLTYWTIKWEINFSIGIVPS